VNQAEDAFASFLSMLAEHLDEHELRGPELAAKLYVSRSLLDRFVAAAAGETTARLRRRVLLERAAFRLKTTPVTILAAATEAGYSSNEAFTRAFRRAYGVSPASWRDSPGPIHIPARSGVPFYPPGGLRLAARTEESPVIFAADMVDHHVVVVGQLLDRAATLPDDSLDAPILISHGERDLRLRYGGSREHRLDAGAADHRRAGVCPVRAFSKRARPARRDLRRCDRLRLV
jgi:AraC family transcriptional regulator